MEKNSKEILVKVYNGLQEKWWALKHDNNAHTSGLREYAHVDITENYYKMQAFEEAMDMIDKMLEEA